MGAQCSNALCVSVKTSPKTSEAMLDETQAVIDQAGQQPKLSSKKITRLEKGLTLIQPEDADPEEINENIIIEERASTLEVTQKDQPEAEEQFYDALDNTQDLQQNLSTNAEILDQDSQKKSIISQTGLAKSQEIEECKKELAKQETLTIPQYNICHKSAKSNVHSNFKRMKRAVRRVLFLYSRPEKYGIDRRQLGLIKFGDESLWMLSQICQITPAGYEEIHYAKKSSHQLKIFYRYYTNPQGKKVQSFLFEYYVSCTTVQFGHFCENFNEQKNLIPEVETFQLLEDLKVQAATHSAVFYRAYPQIVVSKGREFVYLKTSEYGKDYYRDVCRSIDHPAMPENNHHVRAEMVLVGNYAVNAENSAPRKPRTKLKCIAETDVKASVPAFIVKQVAKRNVKQMVERIVTRLDNLYR